MGQITIRADDDLIFRIRQRARETGRSMNEYVTIVLDAVTNPGTAGTERERLRERLARAGLLAVDPPYRGPIPDPDAVEEAGRELGKGTPLSEIIREMRDESW
jgi:plasmid stability protein